MLLTELSDLIVSECTKPEDYAKAFAVYLDRKTSIIREIREVLIGVFRTGTLYSDVAKTRINEEILPKKYWYTPIRCALAHGMGSDYALLPALTIAKLLDGAIDKDESHMYDAIVDQSQSEFSSSLRDVIMDYDSSISFGMEGEVTESIVINFPYPILMDGEPVPNSSITVDETTNLDSIITKDTSAITDLHINLFKTMTELGEDVNRTVSISVILEQLSRGESNIQLSDIKSQIQETVGINDLNITTNVGQLCQMACNTAVSVADRIKSILSTIKDENGLDINKLEEEDIYDSSEFLTAFSKGEYSGSSMQSMWNVASCSGIFKTAYSICSTITTTAGKLITGAFKSIAGGVSKLWRKYVEPMYESHDFVKTEYETTENYCDVPIAVIGSEDKGFDYSEEKLADMVFNTIAESTHKNFDFQNSFFEVEVTSGVNIRKFNGPSDLLVASHRSTKIDPNTNVIGESNHTCKLLFHDVNGNEIDVNEAKIRFPDYSIKQADLRVKTSDGVTIRHNKSAISDASTMEKWDALFYSTSSTVTEAYGEDYEAMILVDDVQLPSASTGHGLLINMICHNDSSSRQSSIIVPNASFRRFDAQYPTDGRISVFTDFDHVGGHSFNVGRSAGNHDPNLDSDFKVFINTDINVDITLRVQFTATQYSSGSVSHHVKIFYDYTKVSSNINPDVWTVCDIIKSTVPSTECVPERWSPYYSEDPFTKKYEYHNEVYLEAKLSAIYELTLDSRYAEFINDTNVINFKHSVTPLQVEWTTNAITFNNNQAQTKTIQECMELEVEHWNVPLYYIKDRYDLDVSLSLQQDGECYLSWSTVFNVDINGDASMLIPLVGNDDFFVVREGSPDKFYDDDESAPRFSWNSDFTIVDWWSLPVSKMDPSEIIALIGAIRNPIDVGCACVSRYNFGVIQYLRSIDDNVYGSLYVCPINSELFINDDLTPRFVYRDGGYSVNGIQCTEDEFVKEFSKALRSTVGYTPSTSDGEQGDAKAYRDLLAAKIVMDIFCYSMIHATNELGSAFTVNSRGVYDWKVFRKTVIKNQSEYSNADFIALLWSEEGGLNYDITPQIEQFTYSYLTTMLTNKLEYMRIYFLLFGSAPKFFPYLIGDRLQMPKWHISTDSELQAYVDKLFSAIVIAALIAAASVIIGVTALKIRKKFALKMEDRYQTEQAIRLNGTNQKKTILSQQDELTEMRTQLKSLDKNSEEYKTLASSIKEKASNLKNLKAQLTTNNTRLLKEQKVTKRWSKLASVFGVAQDSADKVREAYSDACSEDDLDVSNDVDIDYDVIASSDALDVAQQSIDDLISQANYGIRPTISDLESVRNELITVSLAIEAMKLAFESSGKTIIPDNR